MSSCAGRAKILEHSCRGICMHAQTWLLQYLANLLHQHVDAGDRYKCDTLTQGAPFP
jgi:hypothetical protein